MRTGSGIRRRGWGNVKRAAPANLCQPRLTAEWACLNVTFEN
jgi:hypothetical protein